MTNLQVVTWPVEKLIPYARNARTHSAEQVAQVAASIAEFGWTNPILAGADGIVIAGHARLLAARKLGMTEVPVIVLDHLTESQRRALVLADNRLALNAGWDEEMLRVEMAALDDDGFNLEVVGFTDEEIADLLRDPEEVHAGNTDDDAVPETPETAITVPGDTWLLGQHRLLCGDSVQMESVEKVLAGGLADMVFCDPPYNVNYGATMKDKLRGKARKIANDDLGQDFEQFLRDACVNILAVTKGAIYVCMSSSELHTLQKAFREAGGHWSTFVIWAKNTFTMGRSDYQRQYEPILYGWKEGTRSLLVRSPRPGRRVVHQEAACQRSAPDDEAGGTGRACRPEQQQGPRHGARSVRRLRHDSDRVRKDRPPGARDRVGTEVLRRDHPPVAGVHRRGGVVGWRRQELHRSCCRANPVAA